jgi:REP-associated tyrosine transposase
MPRSARIDMPGLLQHVMVRGIEKRDIFMDDKDRQSFLVRFSKLLLETHTDCLAWALLSNHVHLLLRPRQEKLARLMRRLLTCYATTFNLRYHRAGHLFQNRYKSIVCEEEPYLLELVRYIHLNPLRAGIVGSLDELDCYPWSGHAVLLGGRELPGQATDEVLSRFGRRPREARRHYRTFILDGIERGKRDDLSGGGLRRSLGSVRAADNDELFDARILGSSAFVEGLRRENDASEPAPIMPLDALIKRVAGAFGVEAEALRLRKRNKQLAATRSVLCYFAVREMGHNGADVGRMLNISRAGVSAAASRGEIMIRADRTLRDLLA